MLSLKIFPAGNGDCFICEFLVDGKPFRMLIDGGTVKSSSVVMKYLKTLPESEKIDLIIVTHIDGDHIGGILEILRDPEIRPRVKEVWFNGFNHLVQGIQSFDVRQAEELTDLLLNSDYNWNETFFGGGPVMIKKNGEPEIVLLGENCKIIILSPGEEQLRALRDKWLKSPRYKKREEPSEDTSGIQRYGMVDIYGLASAKFKEDESATNASSIAFLLEVGGRTIFFSGDCLPSVVCNALGSQSPKNIDLFKVSHHGAAANTDERILKALPAKRYIVSTDGVKHPHPSDEAMARIIKFAPKPFDLIFNYTTEYSSVWDDSGLSEKWGFNSKFRNEEDFLEIELSYLEV